MYTSVIPTNIYGPHDNFHLEDGHVIPALINKCYAAKRDHTDLVCWGSGTPLRQFIFAEDLAKLFVWSLRHYQSIEPLILSVPEGDEVSIKDVVELVADAFQFDKSRIVHDTSKEDGQFKKTACNDKLKHLCPEFKFTPIREGLQASVDWFVANYDTARK